MTGDGGKQQTTPENSGRQWEPVVHNKERQRTTEDKRGQQGTPEDNRG